MTKTFRDNGDINIVQQTSCEPLFPVVQMQLKTYFFVPFYAHVCISIMVYFQEVMHAEIAGGI